jgi:glycosyltransferase involved in cell wall biosynthesis
MRDRITDDNGSTLRRCRYKDEQIRTALRRHTRVAIVDRETRAATSSPTTPQSMKLRPDLKTFALESRGAALLFAFAELLRARLTKDPYRRATAFLRAWRATDHPLVVEPTINYLRSLLIPDRQLRPLSENSLLQSFTQTSAAQAMRRAVAEHDTFDRVRLRSPRPDEDEARQGDLIVLKPRNDEIGEKGVLLVKYGEAIESFAALYDVERLVRHYVIVLEPSWWGYQDSLFFLFAGADADVIVQAQAPGDFAFVEQYGMSLVPIRVGAGDWVDPAFFAPASGPRVFDVVMVSSWNPFKRHRDLFDALEELRTRHGRRLKTALIGYPSGLTTQDMKTEIHRRGLSDQCEVFDRIPPSRVADIVAKSRLYVLLSRREGANKAMYEAMFCDTPVLAPADHKGINLHHLNEETGLVFERGRLAETILAALSRSEAYAPRAWALRNTGYRNATRLLNELLERMARKKGQPWTRPIVPKKNQPNLMYVSEADRLEMNPEYERLAEYLRRD